MPKKVHHNKKVAKARGADWLESLRRGRLEARLHPSELAHARINRKLRQADLAARMQMSLSTYCAIERGRRPVKLLMARVIAREVRKLLADVFYEDGDTGKYLVKCEVPLKKKKGEKK